MNGYLPAGFLIQSSQFIEKCKTLSIPFDLRNEIALMFENISVLVSGKIPIAIALSDRQMLALMERSFDISSKEGVTAAEIDALDRQQMTESTYRDATLDEAIEQFSTAYEAYRAFKNQLNDISRTAAGQANQLIIAGLRHIIHQQPQLCDEEGLAFAKLNRAAELIKRKFTTKEAAGELEDFVSLYEEDLLAASPPTPAMAFSAAATATITAFEIDRNNTGGAAEAADGTTPTPAGK